MKRYSSFVGIILIITLLTLAALWYNVYRLEKSMNERINSVSNALYRFERKNNLDSTFIFKQQFKEQYYISQLDREMNRLIFTITILFAIFGFVSFLNFSSQLHDFTSDQEKRQQDTEDNYKRLHREVINEFTSVNGDVSTLFITRAGELFDQNRPNEGFNILSLALRAGLKWHDGLKIDNPNSVSFATTALSAGIAFTLEKIKQHGVDFNAFKPPADASGLFKTFIVSVDDQGIRANCVKILELLPKQTQTTKASKP